MDAKRRKPDARHGPVNALVDNWKRCNLTYRDAFILVALWRKAQYATNRVAKISQEKLAASLGIRRSHLCESLDRIERAGFIQRTRGATGRTTVYQIQCPDFGDNECPEKRDNDCPDFGDNDCPENGDTIQSASSDCSGEISPMPPLFAPPGGVSLASLASDNGAAQVLAPPSVADGVERRWREGGSPNECSLADIPDAALARLCNCEGWPFEYFREAINDSPTERRRLCAEALEHLGPHRANDRDPWRDVGMALHHEFEGDDEGLALWDEFSKRCPEKYAKNDARSGPAGQWKTFKLDKLRKRTLGSLLYWAYEDTGWRPGGNAKTVAKDGEEDEDQIVVPRGFVPSTREQYLKIVNDALTGKYGGRIEVARVEKFGRMKGEYHLITAAGQRIVLGPYNKLRQVGHVQEAIWDQTTPSLMIPMYKKGWPFVVNAIGQLAEVQDIGSAKTRVAEWLESFIGTCVTYATDRGKPEKQKPGTLEWRREKFPLFGRGQSKGALRGEQGQIFLHFDTFARYCRDLDRGGLTLQPAEIRAALTELGFKAGRREARLIVETQKGKRIERRAWVHPDWSQWEPPRRDEARRGANEVGGSLAALAAEPP